MLIKVVGSRRLNFQGANGEVKGTQYAFLFEDPRCQGYWFDKFFIPDSDTRNINVSVGHDYDVQCYFRSSRLDLSTLTLVK